MEQADEQLSREPRPLPVMRLNPDVKSLFDFRYGDFTLEGYDPVAGDQGADVVLSGRKPLPAVPALLYAAAMPPDVKI